MKYLYIFLLIICIPLHAQTWQGSYKFIELPFSSKASGLGGINVSTIDRDLSLVYQNPALLSKDMTSVLSLDYMNYFLSINAASAGYAQSINNKMTWMVGINFVDYGSFKETIHTGEIIGQFNAQDIAFNGAFSYKFSDKWSGGVAARVITSFYEKYYSLGLGFDLGLLYYNPEKYFSFGLAVKNIGTQFVSFSQESYEFMPWNLQIGLSQRLKHAPFRFSVTLQNLTRWNFDGLPGTSEAESTQTPEQIRSANIAKGIFEHLVIGIDIVPKKENFYISLGYNFDRAFNLSASSSSFLTGLSFGAGVKIKQFQLSAAAAQYHLSGWSLQLSLAVRLADFTL